MKYSLSFHFEPTKHARVEYYDLFFVLCVYLLHLKNVLHYVLTAVLCVIMLTFMEQNKKKTSHTELHGLILLLFMSVAKKKKKSII